MSTDGIQKRKLGAFTIAKNETYFLDIWVNYYSRSIPKEDLFILDHDSDSKETKELFKRYRDEGITIVPIHNELSYNHYWLRDVVQKFQRFMLHSYEIVLFAEPDEIIIPRPDLYAKTLKEYITDKMEESGARLLRCVGYSLEHQHHMEPPIDLSIPIMSQRRFWRYHKFYDKTLISSIECSWSLGFHEMATNPAWPPPDRHLLLVHIHKLDYNLCKAKHKERAAYKWASHAAGFNDTNHNRVAEDEEFDRYFVSDQYTSAPVEPVPPFMEGSF